VSGVSDGLLPIGLFSRASLLSISPRPGTWVAHNARSADLPVREIYLVSYDETPDTERFRTEIHWPITPEEESTT